MAAVINSGPILQADRIFFKTLLDGDWEKVAGTSNFDPRAGGGARDFRFNGLDQQQFRTIAHQLFPNVTQELRGRQNPAMTDIYNGQIHFGPGLNNIEDAAFESPTDSRGSEWRLTQVHGKQFLASAQQLAGSNQDIIVLGQQTSGIVWAEFSTLATVGAVVGAQFAQYIDYVVNKQRHAGWAAVGYLDVVNNHKFDN